ncbi:MAG: hypothetical protein ACYCXW_06710 [Solirubrobacteraceae bacterium]
MLLELAAGALAVAVAVRLLVAPTRELIGTRRYRQLGQRWKAAPLVARPTADESDADSRRPAS